MTFQTFLPPPLERRAAPCSLRQAFIVILSFVLLLLACCCGLSDATALPESLTGDSSDHVGEESIKPHVAHSSRGAVDEYDLMLRRYQDRVARVERTGQSTPHTPPLGLEPFNCPKIGKRNKTSTSVHSLHPQDIKVVMAMGDSVTAAFGAMGTQGLTHDLLEWRGWSFSIGGAPNASTVPKFLQHYNPGVVGMSLGEHEWEFCWGLLCPERRHPELDQLNAAQSFAMMYNMANGPGNQLAYLVDTLKSSAYIDYANDWKLLTLYIGSNDMCAGCDNHTAWQPVSYEQYKQYFHQMLFGLKASVPRLFVNVVQLLRVSDVYNITLHSEYCRSMHESIFKFECSCAFANSSLGREQREKMDELTDQYNLALQQVVDEISAVPSNDFAAVIQPGFTRPDLDLFPVSFLSTIDCFHPSLAAHQAMAKVLWNNMLAPQKEKGTTFDYMKPYTCPTEDTILATT